MTLRQTAGFIVAYAIVVAVAIWFNLALLCQGDLKYDHGCGGFGLYIPLWLTFLAPLPAAAILLELWRKSSPPPTSRLVGYLLAIVIVAEVGFLLIDRFPVLLAIEAIAIIVGCAVRVVTARSRSHQALGS